MNASLACSAIYWFLLQRRHEFSQQKNIIFIARNYTYKEKIFIGKILLVFPKVLVMKIENSLAEQNKKNMQEDLRWNSMIPVT